jgi:DNA repair ATPase RecN
MSRESGALPDTTHGNALRELLEIADQLHRERRNARDAHLSQRIRQCVANLRMPDVEIDPNGRWTAMEAG